MKTHIETLELATLKSQEVNARFMRGDMFRQLVDNLRRDGSLTSVPLVRPDGDGHRILSGHHRIAAAVEAGIVQADCMVLDEDISREQEVALVLSHNSLSGEDDPATLVAMYDELQDTDWRAYSGLDDRALELLDDVTTDGLSEANLEFSTVQFVFLPHERDEAEAALFEAKKRGAGIENWCAALAQYEDTLDAIETTQAAYGIGNIATALDIVLRVFNRHVCELDEGWVDGDGQPRKKGKKAPMETVFGSRLVPGEQAAVIRQAVQRARKNGDLDESDDAWALIGRFAQQYVELSE